MIDLRNVTKGDQVLFYRTGDEKAVIGIMVVIKAPYADPKRNEPKLVVADVKPIRRYMAAIINKSRWPVIQLSLQI